MKINTADEYLQNHPEWISELTLLRSILIDTELTETIKWGIPTYTIKNKNVVGLAAFKNHVGLWFFNGALLKDRANMLMNAQEGITVAQRQWRFQSISEIDKNLVAEYIAEAIQNQKEGKEVVIPKKKKVISEMLKNKLSSDENLKANFKKLTPGKQNEYHEYIESAKREATKVSRIDKIIPMILNGVGLNDKYKK